ncbi:hypothetical protein [Sphingomonas sp.]|uniref:hypothetical protein n=1 Tax=Sphingomonas sp. TaxID=28214 RepID=UPI001B06B034|nr:hypothetical protein [Sphingomonas sp.]MBO9714259.1 hypothetical protein [Sphingomonas sp.]
MQQPPPSDPTPRPNLTVEDVESFQALFLEVYGDRLEHEEAAELATSLVRFMSLVYRPITYGQLERARALLHKWGLSDILDA